MSVDLVPAVAIAKPRRGLYWVTSWTPPTSAGGRTTQRVTYTATAIEAADVGKLTIRFTSGNDRARVLTVTADRRLLKA